MPSNLSLPGIDTTTTELQSMNCNSMSTTGMFLLRTFIFLIAGLFVQAAVNGPCTANGTPGVCIASASCSSGGGTTHSGFCPNDATDIKCCTKTSCGSGGNCRFTSSCTSGNVVSGLCPGPTDFKCCIPTSGCTPPVPNAATINLVKEFEGFIASPEPDPVGLPTVGYGHLCETEGCAEVPYSFPLTEVQASTLLDTDLKKHATCIAEDIVDNVRLNDNQFGALVSWSFNVGCGATGSSTLVVRLNAEENPNTVAKEELPKWKFAGGKVLPGLVRRRAAEVALFQTNSPVIAHPPC